MKFVSNLPDPIRWENGKVVIIDQTQSADGEISLDGTLQRCLRVDQIAPHSWRTAIGIAAAYAGTLAAFEFGSRTRSTRISSEC